ncbi:unnamed protein product [Arctia plantaginis]|uniref:Uncharacterized protein n=1 Tax=Arctia plantaginis TaxID=874455 RepID=A0A8S0YZ73_ARCPL|nr:unnamed protein product [Arctia plantaginis]
MEQDVPRDEVLPPPPASLPPPPIEIEKQFILTFESLPELWDKTHTVKRGITHKRFKNNMPGPDYATRFLKRHQDSIFLRMCQNIKKSRAQVSPDTINEYFQELEESLKEIDPKNIVNYDETNLSDDPGRKKVIVKRGTKYPERVLNQSRSSISIMMAGTAAGELLPPYVIYKANNIYDTWTTGGPKGIIPVDRNQVLSRLPSNENEDPDKSRYAVDKSVLQILKEMRYGTMNIKEPTVCVDEYDIINNSQEDEELLINNYIDESASSIDYLPGIETEEIFSEFIDPLQGEMCENGNSKVLEKSEEKKVEDNKIEIISVEKVENARCGVNLCASNTMEGDLTRLKLFHEIKNILKNDKTMRKTEELRAKVSTEALLYSATSKLRSECNIDFAKVVRDISEGSPTKAARYRQSLESTNNNVPFTENEALSLYVELGLSQSKYQLLRNAHMEKKTRMFPAY